MTTRLVIVDDQEVVREGLRAILGTVPGFEVASDREATHEFRVPDRLARLC